MVCGATRTSELGVRDGAVRTNVETVCTNKELAFAVAM